MESEILLDDGVRYPLFHRFSPSRVLIDFNGGAVFADLVSGTPNVYELSGEPCRENEREIFRNYVPDGTTVTVTKSENE